MGWLVGLIVAGAAIYFLIVSKRFRVIVGGILAAGVAAGFIAYFYNEADQRRRESLIKTSDLTFSDVALLREKYSSGYKFVATVRNNSAHAVSQIKFLVRAYDCAKTPCAVVGEDEGFEFIGIPSRQIRKMEEYIFFSDMPPVTNFTWDYQVKQVIAE